MAYKRNLAFPLAPTFGEDKPKKKRTTSYGTGSKTVKKGSGATKTTAISDSGRKKTVTKTSRKGATTSRTKTISPDYKSITYTKKKDGKVVKNKTVKSQTQRERSMLEASGGDYKSVAKRQAKKAVKLTNKPADIKAKQEKRADKKEDRESDRYSRQRKRAVSSRKRKGHRDFQKQERKKNRIESCKGTKKGSKKCASARKRF